MKKYLVIGGAGFIGSNLVMKLAESNDNKIVSLDNYLTGKVSNHVKGVTYIKGEAKQINSIINFKPEIIFHLGEYSRVEKSFEDVDLVFKNNYESIYYVLKFAKKNNSKLVYAGSSTKFDKKKGFSLSPYTWTKSINSELIKEYSTWFNLNYAIVYFYNVYGPNELNDEFGTLIGKFKKSMKDGDKLNVVLPGTQRRNFTHVEDIVNGLIIVSEKGEGDGYGIGNQASYSILEIANLFGGQINYLIERKGNRDDSELIVEKTIKLGWSAKHSIKDYILKLRKNNWID